MANTTGERTFSTAGREVKEKVFPLIPPGNHTGTLGSDVSIGKKDAYDAVPYVNVSFEVDGTAQAEGGKNMRAFHMLFLSVLPGKDGEVNTDRPDGITALAQALGTELEGIEIMESVAKDPETGEEKKLEYLNPKQVAEWVKGFKGANLAFRVKTEKGSNGYKDKSKIQKFLLPES